MKKSREASNCWNTIGVWSSTKSRCEKLEEFVHCRNCPVFSEVGRSVLEQSAPSGYLADWRKAIASAALAKNKKTQSILVFRVNREWYAIPVAVLSEVANDRFIHQIPRNMNQSILGIVNINGEIKLCYSLPELLGIKHDQESPAKAADSKPNRLIVIELGEREYVFRVNELQGIRWYGEADLQPLPATIDSVNAEVLLGVVLEENTQVAVFNTDKLQERLERVVL